ncbi:HTH_Tnp_Tc3_2 domain-containing protein [Trichonephila clavipes]|nr:HTH_Tnp_Tc3_2 domain-containing protein [Trichonephila clavipes]
MLPLGHLMPDISRTPFYRSFGPKEEKDFCAALVADHSVASGRRISSSTVRRSLHNSALYAKRPVVCVNRRQRRAHLSCAREHVSWTRQRWASVLFTDESRFTLDSDSGRLLIWRERSTKYHQSNTVERQVTEVVE